MPFLTLFLKVTTIKKSCLRVDTGHTFTPRSTNNELALLFKQIQMLMIINWFLFNVCITSLGTCLAKGDCANWVENGYQLLKTNWTERKSITNQENFLLTCPHELWLVDRPSTAGQLDNFRTSFDCWRPLIAHQRPRNPPAEATSSDEKLQEHHNYCWCWCRLMSLSYWIQMYQSLNVDLMSCVTYPNYHLWIITHMRKHKMKDYILIDIIGIEIYELK